MIYVFDIDGTLADISHRLHFIQQEPKDWRGFFAACTEDLPISDIIDVLRALHAKGHTIVLISGRSDEVRGVTEAWFNNYCIPYNRILMRKHGDHREDSMVKAELLDAMVKQFRTSFAFIGGVFEDRKQVVDMYRAKGLRVFQVAEGNF